MNKKKLVVISVIIYIVLSVILFNTYYGGQGNETVTWNMNNLYSYFKNSFNIIPFKTIIGYIFDFINQTKNNDILVTNILGNIIVFMPFALFLPLLFKNMNKFKNFFLIMFVIVLSREIIQLVTLRGSFDIDDIILNISGALLIYLILKLKTLNLKNNTQNYEAKFC